MLFMTRLQVATTVAAAIALAGTVTQLRPQSNQIRLVLVDREGRKTPVGFLPSTTFAPRISPDGKQLTWDTLDGTVWVSDLSNLTAARRLALANYPMWSADGAQIAFTSTLLGEETLYMRRADGAGAAEWISAGRAPESWSAPNQMLSFIKLDGYYSIWTYSLRDKKAAALIDTPGVSQHSSRFSPDGKWIAYASSENGPFEVFVRPFPLTGAKFRIGPRGGGHPLWSPDGKEIFFDNDGQLFAVSVQTAGSFSAAPPVALPVSGFIQGSARRQFDLMPDGKQFLMMFPN
jgi:eukaryotic-like serine/threonine-protein kinase